MQFTALALLAGVLAGCGEDITFQDRRAWRLENDQLRVTVLQGGGHIAELVLTHPESGEPVNPLWIPTWPSIEPSSFDPEQHGETYGRDAEAGVLSGIMGHNVCFDIWGAPSETEFAAGLDFHGEASSRTWRKVSGDGRTLTCRVDLPLTQKSLTRTMRLLPGQSVLYFEEVARNHLGADQPFGWVQHVTFGPPFVDRDASIFDASATAGDMTWSDQEVSLNWGETPAEGPELNLQRFSQQEEGIKLAHFLMDPEREVSFISAVNTKYRLLVAYVFRRQDYPWLNVWEENRSRKHAPWNGEAMTRGMEFGNTRTGGTAKAYYEAQPRYGTPAFGWLGAKSRQTVRYLALLASVPEGFNGIENIRVDSGEIVIEGRGVTTPLRVPYERSLVDFE